MVLWEACASRQYTAQLRAVSTTPHQARRKRTYRKCDADGDRVGRSLLRIEKLLCQATTLTVPGAGNPIGQEENPSRNPFCIGNERPREKGLAVAARSRVRVRVYTTLNMRVIKARIVSSTCVHICEYRERNSRNRESYRFVCTRSARHGCSVTFVRVPFVTQFSQRLEDYEDLFKMCTYEYVE